MILVVIQARLTSSRLPNKVLLEVNNKPLLKVMLEQLSYSEQLDEVIVAIPGNKENETLREFLEDNSISHIVGDEWDVLGRYFFAGKKYNSVDAIVRLTSDCPLIDPELVDDMINFFRNNNYDYIRTGSTFADGQGVEVFTWKALEEAYNHSTSKVDREHVTTFFKDNPHIFKCYTIQNEIDDSGLRYTVDTKYDFEVVKRIIENLDDGYFINQQKIRKFLNEHPQIKSYNSHLQRHHLDGKL